MKTIANRIALLSLMTLSLSSFAQDNSAPPPKTAELFTYDRIYSDKDGNSHFDKVTLNFQVFKYSPNIPPVWAVVGGPKPAKSFVFMAAPTNWDGRADHPPRSRQFFVVLTGAVGFTTSDGETKILQPGQVLLMDDHKGKGHGSFNAGQGVAQVMAIQLPDD